jgi:hypothetical protein
MVPAVPYRSVTLSAGSSQPETFSVRVPDMAVEAWLAERQRLRAQGYPDRPPDVDTLTLRAWLPRPGEHDHPYFAGRATPRPMAESIWPIYTALWHAPERATTKVLVSGTGDGGIRSRVVVEHSTGERPVDKVKVYPPDADPDTVWREVETIVMAIDAARLGWGPDDPMVTTYLDFVALDDEVQAAEAEARAAGLLAPEWLH